MKDTGNNNILDSILYYENKENKFVLPKRWWESKRLQYNIIIVFFSMIMIFNYHIGVQILGYKFIIKFTVIYLLISNAFYTLSWFIEIRLIKLKFYYKNLKKSRNILYLTGVLFSIIVTLKIYSKLLYWHDYYGRI